MAVAKLGREAVKSKRLSAFGNVSADFFDQGFVALFEPPVQTLYRGRQPAREPVGVFDLGIEDGIDHLHFDVHAIFVAVAEKGQKYCPDTCIVGCELWVLAIGLSRKPGNGCGGRSSLIGVLLFHGRLSG